MKRFGDTTRELAAMEPSTGHVRLKMTLTCGSHALVTREREGDG